MALVAVSDDLKEVLDSNKDRIKDEYVTYRLFVDSAIREKLRKMGIKAGPDEIIKHMEKLHASKSRHLDKQAVRHTVTRHKLRVARAKRNMEQI